MGAGIICAPALMELEGRQGTALLVSDSADVTIVSPGTLSPPATVSPCPFRHAVHALED